MVVRVTAIAPIFISTAVIVALLAGSCQYQALPFVLLVEICTGNPSFLHLVRVVLSNTSFGDRRVENLSFRSIAPLMDCVSIPLILLTDDQ